MDTRNIDNLANNGFWIQVSPLAHKNWIGAVYKQGKKTGNWITEVCKEFETPHECYDWAYEFIHKLKTEQWLKKEN